MIPGQLWQSQMQFQMYTLCCSCVRAQLNVPPEAIMLATGPRRLFGCCVASCVMWLPATDEEDVEGAESREHKRWIERCVSCCCSGQVLWCSHIITL